MTPCNLIGPYRHFGDILPAYSKLKCRMYWTAGITSTKRTHYNFQEQTCHTGLLVACNVNVAKERKPKSWFAFSIHGAEVTCNRLRSTGEIVKAWKLVCIQREHFLEEDKKEGNVTTDLSGIHNCAVIQRAISTRFQIRGHLAKLQCNFQGLRHQKFKRKQLTVRGTIYLTYNLLINLYILALHVLTLVNIRLNS